MFTFCGKSSNLTRARVGHMTKFHKSTPAEFHQDQQLASWRSLTPSFFWAESDDLIYFFEFFHGEEFRAKETYVMRQIIYHKGTCIQGSFISSKLVNEPFSCPSFITRQSPKPLLKNGRNWELLLCRSILSWTCNAVLTLLTIIVFVAVSFFFFVHGLRRS